MYHHVKKLMYSVNVGEPDVRFGNMLLEQFGGANGNSLPPCSTRSKAGPATTLNGGTC